MTLQDELETSIRTALRVRAEDIPDEAPPPFAKASSASGSGSASTPRSRAGVKWAAGLAAAAVVAGVLVVPRMQRDDQRVDTAQPAPNNKTGDFDVLPTTDTVVFRSDWGSGPQQIGSPRFGQSVLRPGPIAVSKDERHVFVADGGNGRVVRIDVATGRIDRTYPLADVEEVAVDPVTGDLYTRNTAGVVDATTPDGATRRVRDKAATDQGELLLTEVDGPPDEAGVYGVFVRSDVEEEPTMFRISGTPRSFLGWRLGDALVGFGYRDGVLTVDTLDGERNRVGSVLLSSERGWEPDFTQGARGMGDRLRVVVTERQGNTEIKRLRLFEVDGTPAIRTVYILPKLTTEDAEITANAVWALELTDDGVELHKVLLAPS